MSRLSTGVTAFDRSIGGGVPSGSLVVLRAPPASESQRLVHALVGERPTLYLTTLHTPSAVRDRLQRSSVESTGLVVRRLDGHAPLEDARDLLADLPSQANVVVDTTTPLERRADPGAYREFLDGIVASVAGVDGLALLHCMAFGDGTVPREYALSMADAVWRFRRSAGESGLETQLVVEKSSHCAAAGVVAPLEFEAGIGVDTPRDIA